jgi:hypothetical protein
MIVLFALGVMSVLWMAVVAALIFAQKVLRHGASLTKGFAVCLAALGIWVTVAPASVPGLTQPDSKAAGRAMQRMMGSGGAAKPNSRTARPKQDGMQQMGSGSAPKPSSNTAMPRRAGRVTPHPARRATP